mgnify:CR=1 FL=1
MFYGNYENALTFLFSIVDYRRSFELISQKSLQIM